MLTDRDDRGMWHPERIREQLRERLPDEVAALRDGAERAAKLAEALAQAGIDDPVGAAIARLPLGAAPDHVAPGPVPGSYSLGTLADFDRFLARIEFADYAKHREPKPPARRETRRSRQVRSSRARAKRRTDERIAARGWHGENR